MTPRGDVRTQLEPVEMSALDGRRCRECGCTDDDCRECVERTGEPCSWVPEPNAHPGGPICSACLFSVMFACNDHRNGMASGRCAGVHVWSDGSLIELDADDLNGPVFRWEHRDGHVRARVGRRLFPIEGHPQSWVGNWCWDSCAMRLSVLKELLAHLVAIDFHIIEEAEGVAYLLPDGASFFPEGMTS